MARTEEWLDMKCFHEAIKDMPSLYKEQCLPFLFLRKQIDRFLDPRVVLTEQIASFLKLEAGESPTLYCLPAQPSDDGTPKDLSLEVNQFTSLLNLEVARMNNFLVSTHRSQARAANHYMLMRQEAERRQKLIKPAAFPHGRVRSEELEEIRLATYRLFTYMYQLIIFSKINYKAIETILQEHDQRTGSEITSTYMDYVKTQDFVTFREAMITETELCFILTL
ncbi:unnamed protein product [Sphagnum jensenii]|uniref:SPX domain-containing protein n=1 Tax=Sphagnum jensenii TaxID=128206 RepID=A0ABP0WZS7_9BRYO